jgi:DNA-binding transcriptional MerR regulator
LMPEQLDLFSSVREQEQNPVEKASTMLMERRLKPPAVIMQNQQPDIVVPRNREMHTEKINPSSQNRLNNEIKESPSPAPQDKIDNSQVQSPGKNVGEVSSIEPELPAIHTPEKEIVLLKEISEITSVPVAVISEPIAIIAVKPVEEEKPKTARGRKSIKEMSMEADLPQVPEDEKLFSKQYYGIGEVATMFQVNASLLRYWETEFDVLKPKKNGKGDRFFRPEDIKNLQIIHHLLRQKKFTIQGAKDYLKNNKQSKEKFEMVKQLQQLKAFLLEMKVGL